MLSVSETSLFVIASERRERGKQQARNPDTVDCHEAKASRNDKYYNRPTQPPPPYNSA